MSGRHRKPTNSSFSVAKIAVTGAVIGGGSIGLAAQAQAASDSEWDTVAACESSGNWAINTGNGYQGGLQFSPGTWLSYGGGQFASAANMATKSQQIAIAEKVLAGQGRGAWPVCGRGLSGATQRDVASLSAPTKAPVVQASAPAPADSPAPVAPLDNPLPEQAPAPQEHVSVPEDLPTAPQDVSVPEDLPTAPQDVPTPQDTPAPQDVPAPQNAPAQNLPAPQAPAATDQPIDSKPQIISISQETLQADPETTIVEAALLEPAPLAPADPAVPPAVATTVVPAAPGADTVVAAAPLPEGVQHLPSPDSPPPGTTTDPGAPTGSPNVSYLKDLWHAVQNQEIDRNDLLLALAQRSFTGPMPADSSAPAPQPAG